ncbi:hypothetical protein THMIRHAS_03600 [Thiosulfatimonas sediminis]|uniref:histidine kinase n=1 Tax=Thiosulfatimonas sediminis TaxID=2675054 RepID=A0A6F8PSH9_9GAMM|nr:response regulator [Thiosulfatimonas sediminis]BBP44987.1 hypothetical protein THMIRHAS_03600 [Thiosulfatimonas sediminis]
MFGLSNNKTTTGWLFIFLSALSALIFAAFGMAYLSYQNQSANEMRQLDQLSQNFALQLNQNINNRKDTLERFASNLIQDNQLLSDAQLQNSLDSRIRLHDYFGGGLAILNQQGEIIRHSPAQSERVGESFANKPFFRVLNQSLRTYTSPPSFDKQLNQMVIYIITPISDKTGQPIAYLLGIMSLQGDLVSNIKPNLRNGGDYSIYDLDNHLVIYSSEKSLAMQSMTANDNPLLSLILSGRFTGALGNAFNDQKLYSAYQLEDLPWLVILTIDNLPARQTAIQQFLNLLVLLAVFLSFAMMLYRWRLKQQLVPIRALSEALLTLKNERNEIHPITLQSASELDAVSKLQTLFNDLAAHNQEAFEVIRQQARQAEQDNTDTQEFLSRISQELRTPLNSVVGLSALQMQDSHLTEQALERTYHTHFAGLLMLNLINDVLDDRYSRKHPISIERTQFKLDQVIEQLAIMFTSSNLEKKNQLLFNVNPSAPNYLIGDPLRLTQLLSNLISNSIKFTRGGTIELVIDLVHQRNESQIKLNFCVRDSGAGIEQQKLSALMQNLKNGHYNQFNYRNSHGLGLVISERLLLLMGGDALQIRSEVGGGTEVCFSLEFQTAHINQQKTLFKCLNPTCRALIIEQSQASGDILSRTLKAWGFIVEKITANRPIMSELDTKFADDKTYDVIFMESLSEQQRTNILLKDIQRFLEQHIELNQPMPKLVCLSNLMLRQPIQEVKGVAYLALPFSRSALFNTLNQIAVNKQENIYPLNQTKTIRFNQQNILVVEDNQLNAEFISQILQNINLHTHHAETGQQAIELLKNETFDLVLMDLQMPGLNGFETTKRIREFNIKIPIIALTAAAMPADKEKALKFGMNAYLTKPIDDEQLKSTLSEYLLFDRVTAAIDAVPIKQLNAPKQPSILIAETLASNASLLSDVLQADYLVESTLTGEQVLQIARSDKRPDVLLLDINMPNIDGLTLCKKLKEDEQTKHISIILLCDAEQAIDVEKGLRLGALDYLFRPYSLPIVHSRIRNHLALKIKTEMLEQLSDIDSLTKLPNRRQFEETLFKESKRLARSEKMLGIILIDMDSFKAYNEHYGHGLGDECLHKVAHAMNNILRRPADMLARYAGEEFVALLPETDLIGTQKVAEQFCQVVRDLHIPHEHSKVASELTVSLGYSAAFIQTPQDANNLLQRTDKFLYHAKALGRNRIFGPIDGGG